MAPVATVADGDLITPAWGNSVSSSVADLEADVAAAYHPGGTDVAIADGGTGASTAAAAATALGVGTGDSPQFAGVNVGHATDTTIGRASAGDISVEGNRVFRAGGADVPIADGGTGASSAAGAQVNLGIQTGRTTAGSAIAAGAQLDVVVTFGTPYADTNYTIVAIAGGVNNGDIGKFSIGQKTKTASDCTLTVTNNSANSRTPVINWIAIHD